MNFSSPLNLQGHYNRPNAYTARPYPFPQVPESVQPARFYPQEALWQCQEELMLDEQEAFMYQAMKKLKGPNASNLDRSVGSNMLFNLSQRNETIKPQEMTSPMTPKYVNNPVNYFGQRPSPNQRPEVNRDLDTANYLKSLMASQANNEALLHIDPRALQNYQEAVAMQQMQNSARERTIGFLQQFLPQQASVQQTLDLQLNLLQNLNQKANEQLALNLFNQMTPNSVNLMPQAINVYNQQLHKEQSNLEMLLMAQNRLRLEQEAQRVYSEIMRANKNVPVRDNLLDVSKLQFEGINFEDFPEIHFDQLLPDSYTLENDITNGKFAEEVLKLKELEELDDKRTAETSLSTNSDEVLFKEFPENYSFNFQPESYHLKKQIQAQQNKEATLLKKRAFDSIDKDEKRHMEKITQKHVVTHFEQKKEQIKQDKIQSQQVNYLKVPVTQLPAPVLSPSGLEEIKLNTETEFGVSQVNSSPIPGKQKKPKAKPVPSPTFELKPIVKRERKMNKLQTMRVALDNFLDELKKPYVIHLHHDGTDPEQKVAMTRVGQGYQAPEASQCPPRNRRAIKLAWNPSSIDSNKLEEFYERLNKIFEQDVHNQEAALKILRGTGMNVDSTIDIIQSNALYFKAILFPEPKPVKGQRFY